MTGTRTKALAVLLALALLPAGASACTAVYLGSDLTADGSLIFGRLEEFFSDEGWPKLFETVPEGAHAAGAVYTGCFGFTWTFSLYPDGRRASWYWVFAMLEHIARDDADAAAQIRQKTDALQDDICAYGETGNRGKEQSVNW